MPRNGSGVASVVNTFTPLTTADANQVNDNFNDMADMLTDSLPRDGQAGMTGQLLAISGTASEPGISFNADPNTGIRRSTGDTVAIVCGGVDVATIDGTGVTVPTPPFIGNHLANKTYIDARTPVGEVKTFAGQTAPTGFLECNGATISRTTYADLFAVIGTAWGAGDGSTTFKIPDLRGEFVRGWDHGRGIDVGRTFASAQTEDLKPHSHIVFDPGHVHAQKGSGTPGGATTAQYSGALTAAADQATNTASAMTGITLGDTGGVETRPRNVALMYIIKI